VIAYSAREYAVEFRRTVRCVGGLVLMDPALREDFMMAWPGVRHLTHFAMERKQPVNLDLKRLLEAAP
jgi:hypothetical protein